MDNSFGEEKMMLDRRYRKKKNVFHDGPSTCVYRVNDIADDVRYLENVFFFVYNRSHVFAEFDKRFVILHFCLFFGDGQ